MNSQGKAYQDPGLDLAEAHILNSVTAHVNSISSCCILVIDRNSGNILNDHQTTISNKKMDKDKILHQIARDEKISTSCYRDGLILLPPGCTYTHDTNLKESHIKTTLLDQINCHPGGTDDPFEILVSHIAAEYQNNNCEKLVVRLSGGVDSTCLLLAAIEIAGVNRVTALTWFDDNCSANDDLKAATLLCKTLKINHLMFRLEPAYFFQDVDPKNHFYINAGMATDQVFEKEGDFISRHLGDGYIILDGHGGDHLFLDPVPSAAFQDFISKNIIKGLKIAATVSKLTGSNIYETLSRDRKQQSHDCDQRNDFLTVKISPSLNFKKPESLTDEHLQAVAQALCQNATSATFNKKTKIAYPFTCKEMVEYVLKQDPYNMFNEFDTRLPLRHAVNKKYPDIRLRSDKGHITSAYQKALKHHEKRILIKLKSSWLAKENLINMPHIEKAIHRSALGLGGVDQILLKIICASLIKEI